MGTYKCPPHRPFDMKYIFFFLCVSTTLANGQITFNKHLNLGFPFQTITSVFPTDSCYYATGVIIDTSESFAVGNIFIKFALNGEVDNLKKISSPQKSYETWSGDLTPTSDGGFLDIGEAKDTFFKGLVIKYDGVGDTMFTREFTNPLYPAEDFIYTAEIKPDGAGNFWVLCGYDVSIDPAPSDGDIYLIKIDPEGNILDQFTYGDVSRQNPRSLLVDTDGGVIIGSNKTNTNVAVQNYTSLTHLFKINSVGEAVWQYLSPPSQLLDRANAILGTDDGGLVVATGKGIEHYVVSGANQLRWFPYMFKLDAEQNFEWGREFRGTRHTTVGSIVKVVTATDSSGYVGVSQILEDVSTDEEVLGCWVVKASLTGDSVWARYYSILEGVKSEPAPYDLKNTFDGGYILSGDTWPESVGQNRAWLMKLDQHGCLVPGCEIVGTEETVPGTAHLAIYPNPTTDFLNFQLRGAIPEKGGLFRIVDAGGKVVKAFGAGHLGDTFVLPVSEWLTGTYFLQYLLDGRVVVTEKFIKL